MPWPMRLRPLAARSASLQPAPAPCLLSPWGPGEKTVLGGRATLVPELAGPLPCGSPVTAMAWPDSGWCPLPGKPIPGGASLASRCPLPPHFLDGGRRRPIGWAYTPQVGRGSGSGPTGPSVRLAVLAGGICPVPQSYEISRDEMVELNLILADMVRGLLILGGMVTWGFPAISLGHQPPATGVRRGRPQAGLCPSWPHGLAPTSWPGPPGMAARAARAWPPAERRDRGSHR